MDKIVIFDWGGVVESHEENMRELKEAKIRLVKRYNQSLTEEEILKKWVNETPSKKEAGTLHEDKEIREWISLVQKNLNINVSFEEFKKAYEEEFSNISYYKDVVSFAHSLKEKCRIGILSDLLPFDKKRIDSQYDLKKFDKVYLSFEIGLRKNDIRVFEYVSKDLNIDPSKILFIDDLSSNILLAQKCGWNTCQAFGYELPKIKEAVNKFLE